MGLFSKIGGFLKGAAGVIAPVLGEVFGGPVGGALGTALGGAVSARGGGGGGGVPMAFTGPAYGTGLPPAGRPQPPGLPGGGSPGGMGGFAQGLARGMGARGGARRMKVGRLSGAYIPAGFQEKMSPSGQIYLTRVSRGRGISARDLRSFRKVDRLIHRYSARTHFRKGKR